MASNPFNTVLTDRPRRNNFNLSHDVKMSFKMGRLYPTCVLDVLPGDHFNIGVENMLRFAPLIAPVMHDIRVKTFWFFVPNRLLWEDWEDFITGTDTDLVPPYITSTGGSFTESSLANYLGIPTTIPTTMRIDAMPFAAYALIWDEWFRDQNLGTEVFQILTDGDNSYYDTWAAGNCFARSWEHDYFTSALPWAQKGDSVTLPLVEDTNVLVGMSGTNTHTLLRDAADGTVHSTGGTVSEGGGTGRVKVGADEVMFDPNGTLSVNINEEAVSINTLREAFRMQEFLELDALGGTRYTETIFAHFGVRSRDARLQRPELVGSFSGRMVISEVLQTAPASNTGTAGTAEPLGTMGGHGISVNGGKGLNYKATEHGWLIGLINVQPKAAYQQGLARKWSRSVREDYFWPKFANIGEQAILNKELYVEHTNPDDEFGYIPRYSEYRYEPCRVAGEMRSTLAHWHLGRIFDSDTALNAGFLAADQDSPRIFAVQYEGGGEGDYQADQIFAHIFNNIYASRLIPKYGKPIL